MPWNVASSLLRVTSNFAPLLRKRLRFG